MVRLKLLLALLWMAGAGDHEAHFPARGWAELLDLPEPEVNGARRVLDAIAWLEKNDFITVKRSAGHPSRIKLRREDGAGRKYTMPAQAEQGSEGRIRERDWHIQIPSGFWENGWAAVLSGPAVALLLVLMDMADIHDPKRPVWLSERVSGERYDLSRDTWTRGTRELREHALVTVIAKPVSTGMGWKRRRNTYVVRLERLDQRPGSPIEPKRTVARRPRKKG
jgi:hypothetical protein